jgi:hypothetical protein
MESIYFLTFTVFNIFLPSAGRRQNNVLQKLSKYGPVADGSSCNGVPAVHAATATIGV